MGDKPGSNGIVNDAKKEKKTLMNSLRNLEDRAEFLKEIRKISDNLVYKFQNPNPQPSETGDEAMGKMCTERPAYNLVELFDNATADIENEIYPIKNNLQILNDMFE